MNKLFQIYNILLRMHGSQGWWPLLDDKLVCRHTGRAPKTDNERFEIICGAVLTQNTNWYPNVTRALQQLALGREFKKEEQEVIKKAEISAGEISRRQQNTTKSDILTQNTNWKNVEKALYNLSKNNLINIDKIKKIKKEKLAKLIRPAGYYNQKAERLKLIADFISKNPSPAREQLLNVKGIGPETADSILLYAYNKPFFVIDAYTKRIFQRLGYKADDYEEWQKQFTNNLPKNTEIFNEYHALLVELGKNHCKKKPICIKCPVKEMCKK
jgi:endonuclease-3 related protein